MMSQMRDLEEESRRQKCLFAGPGMQTDLLRDALGST